ncbi:hypothetical protein QJS10_CPA06g00340 [Acorus calamus]|uniref:Remorin n=1 Tax=Acorus calamus TaxID=4465 RepID=A0AAV9EP76_ACOCL|nr:hypothetical protein QJS10_CPA06g00340 [Acorus calamus]
MAEEESHKVEPEVPAEEPPPAAEPPIASAPDVAEVKSVIPPQVTEETPEDSKALAVVESEISLNEKHKSTCDVSNRAQKKVSTIGSWENAKQAEVESELKKVEEKLERKKAEYAERMKNKIALIHKEAEEKRAMVEAKRGEELLKAEEIAAKYRASGLAPKKLLGWFGG